MVSFRFQLLTERVSQFGIFDSPVMGQPQWSHAINTLTQIIWCERQSPHGTASGLDPTSPGPQTARAFREATAVRSRQVTEELRLNRASYARAEQDRRSSH